MSPAAPEVAAAPAPLGPHDGIDDAHRIGNTGRTMRVREQARTVLLSARNVKPEQCRIMVAEDAQVSASSDETRYAVLSNDELEIWNPRTCDAVTHAMPKLVGSTFIGTSHELLLVQDNGGVALTRASRDGLAKIPGTITQRPTRWAVSPDGKHALLGVTDETRSSLAVWNLRNDATPIVSIELPIIEREIDGIAFSRDSKTAVVTVPIFMGKQTDSDRTPRFHLAIAYDTKTWKSTRKVVVSSSTAPRTLGFERNAIVFDGRAY